MGMAVEAGEHGEGWVVVTGASKGLGRATVRALVKEHGAQVLALSRDPLLQADLAKELHGFKGRIRVLTVDVAAEEGPAAVAGALGAARCLALVHNAAVLHKAEFGRHERAALEHCFRVNAIAPLMLTQALAPTLSGSPPGHIVHIGSMGGFQDSAKFPGLVGYSASKAALACMAQCVAEELKDRGIRSNCLALGAADTEMLRTAFPGYQAPTSAESMGGFIAWFALHGHKHFNGKVLPVATSTP